MKTASTLISLIFLVLRAGGQETKPVEKGRLQIGIFSMPAVAYQRELKRDIDFITATGMKIEKKISPRLTMGSGLTYYSVQLDMGRAHGGICPSPLMSCRLFLNRSYLEIPFNLKINYNREERKVNPYLSFGIITAFTTKVRDESTDEMGGNPQILQNDGLRYSQNFMSISFGTAFNFSKRFDLYLEPTFKYSLTSGFMGESDPSVMSGLALGMNYKFM
jgi:hypothetical protein